MMTERRRQILRLLIFMLIALLMAGFQTSFWYHLFGSIPPPMVWLTLVVYLSLYRDMGEGLVSVYLVSLALSVFTSMPEGLLTLLILTMFFAGRFFRLRIFWNGPTYFMLVCAASVPSFYVLQILFSLYFEPNPLTRPDLVRWGLQMCETTLAALFLFPLYEWIDDLMREEANETWRINE
ncbi:MAG TPA: hypothetical protein VFV50_19150 [Bdellovibrionales bacterium]|nr:hypothetical protein [Bdellovibrionales bacterium]